MKHGFKLLLHNDLNSDQIQRAKELFDLFFINTNGYYGTGGWASHSYWKRGILGRVSSPSRCANNINTHDYDMCIRRMSKHRRIFAAIPRTLVDRYNEVDWDQCMCSLHLGGTKIKIPFDEKDYVCYFEIGDIKG